MKHIPEYGGNPKMIFMAGHSAGGRLTAMATLDPKYLGTFGFSPMQLARALPSSGQMTTHFQVLKKCRMQDQQVPQFVSDQYAPLSFVSKDAHRH